VAPCSSYVSIEERIPAKAKSRCGADPEAGGIRPLDRLNPTFCWTLVIAAVKGRPSVRRLQRCWPRCCRRFYGHFVSERLAFEQPHTTCYFAISLVC